MDVAQRADLHYCELVWMPKATTRGTEAVADVSGCRERQTKRHGGRQHVVDVHPNRLSGHSPR